MMRRQKQLPGYPISSFLRRLKWGNAPVFASYPNHPHPLPCTPTQSADISFFIASTLPNLAATASVKGPLVGNALLPLAHRFSQKSA